jgi:aminoglycoside phosphotransferase
VAQVDVPERLRHEYRQWAWSVACQYAGTATTWKLVHGRGQVRYLKLKSAEGTPRLVDEAAKMRWAAPYLPVPTVLAAGTESWSWLIAGGTSPSGHGP